MIAAASTDSTGLVQRAIAKLDRSPHDRDQDGDGRISPAERAATRQNVPGSGANSASRFETALRQADANGDGLVTRQERLAAGNGKPAAPSAGGPRTL